MQFISGDFYEVLIFCCNLQDSFKLVSILNIVSYKHISVYIFLVMCNQYFVKLY